MKKAPVLLILLALLTACAAEPAVQDGEWTPPEDYYDRVDGFPTQLTAEEIEWFNTSFFNNGTDLMPNSLLNCEYESPEDIDFLMVFYDGDGTPQTVTYAEKLAYLAENGLDEDYMLDFTKVTDAGMDAALRKYTGLGLEDTRKNRLDAFTYLEEYGARYLMHGDTNINGFTMLYGHREGDTVRLFYRGFADDMYCVELLTRENGYHFLSNQKV